VLGEIIQRGKGIRRIRGRGGVFVVSQCSWGDWGRKKIVAEKPFRCERGVREPSKKPPSKKDVEIEHTPALWGDSFTGSNKD